ncbi:NPP1 family protein [Nonomuraea sp. NPDC050783]|uniref:NPP1 family protein n=1 Tax=Nonomuraea sp. NPDC050783 TaxID=3154634 RepID=UPI0034671F33
MTSKNDSPVPPARGRGRRWHAALVVALGVSATVLTVSGPARADVLPLLPQNASGLEQTFSPALDYDRDGCYSTAAVTSPYRTNPGLSPSGSPDVPCRQFDRLQNSNQYARAKCNNGWCAIMYASYFEKDQDCWSIPETTCGHRHDWEHVIVWVNNNQARYVSASAHGNWNTQPASNVRFDPSGTHPKIVYHKDGAGTHAFRFANASDDAVENHTGGWFYPRLIGWQGYPGAASGDPSFRNAFVYHTDFGSAHLEIGTASMEYQLGRAKPAGISFDPAGSWS